MSQSTEHIENTRTAIKPPNPRFKNWRLVYRKLKKNKSAMVGGFLILFLIIVAIIGPYFTPYQPDTQDMLNKLQPPSGDNWLGTDNFGRDIFSRIIHGTNLTLIVGFFSVLLGGAVGVLIGIFAGYYGGRTDSILMRLMDILLAFPSILLALAIVTVLGGSLQNVIIAVAISSVPVFARIVRGSTLSVKKLEYIDAMRALGASDARIIFKHIFPNITSPIIVQATLNIATAILSASGLSFLGLGAQPPTPEWGAMLSDGRNYLYNAPHVALFPGLAIVLVVLAFNMLGDGLRDAFDPKTKE
ncbi:nickel transporter permease [Oceanobacillus profundus]|uniref:ABC transporter permease n=1 Tax=Oceanobacillus profundus TaxID=372463 RepID=A0A417YP52_9BACI|nr:nickel transporter permease [Oceanobacillus profundus]MBR3120338.1 ABC transporter permease [Oceanobacillus sp.]PAE30663.1 diguanylate cyclase [Paenibacillus sp. 7884-2]MCM3398763.1 ABC transporter permease [Oceanobacillus profundus]MDO6450163.1 ABC transporter permease [Oceanobacillus profundus]RHW35368.1 ABC transporter permease [Oceanobacillus profundus]